MGTLPTWQWQGPMPAQGEGPSRPKGGVPVPAHGDLPPTWEVRCRPRGKVTDRPLGLTIERGALQVCPHPYSHLPSCTARCACVVVVEHMAGVGCCPATVASLSFRPVPGVGRPEWRVLGTAASLSSRTVPAGWEARVARVGLCSARARGGWPRCGSACVGVLGGRGRQRVR